MELGKVLSLMTFRVSDDSTKKGKTLPLLFLAEWRKGGWCQRVDGAL